MELWRSFLSFTTKPGKHDQKHDQEKGRIGSEGRVKKDMTLRDKPWARPFARGIYCARGQEA
jgi:hypothetical protein